MAILAQGACPPPRRGAIISTEVEDAEFIRRLKEKIESAAGTPIDLEIDGGDKRRLSIDLSPPAPKVVFGADALENPGLARMYSQYVILCLKERRQVSQLEFLLFLRRN